MWKITALVLLAAGLGVCQQGEEKKVYSVGAGVTAPRVLSKVDPEYTKEASAAKIQGPVLLTLIVGSDGVARDIKVSKSLDPGLDEKAVAAVQQWKFQPGTRYGEAVDVKATIEVNFRLLEKKGEERHI
jgi:periplasmic protein TonB